MNDKKAEQKEREEILDELRKIAVFNIDAEESYRKDLRKAYGQRVKHD